MSTEDGSEHISLNKYIAEKGLCSRREADKWIEDGRIKINGVTAKKGNRVSLTDEVTIDDAPLEMDKPPVVYIALHKPVGIVCTTDQREKDNIIDYVHYHERIFPVGRLDKDSEGLILLTNDGDIVNKILRASNAHEKEYVVTVNKPINSAFIKTMAAGIPILDTVTRPCKVVKKGDQTFEITLTQGLNRQIRRMCEFLGYRVTKLVRVRVMHILLQDIPYGQWRYLSEKETSRLLEYVKSSRK